MSPTPQATIQPALGFGDQKMESLHNVMQNVIHKVLYINGEELDIKLLQLLGTEHYDSITSG